MVRLTGGHRGKRGKKTTDFKIDILYVLTFEYSQWFIYLKASLCLSNTFSTAQDPVD